MKQMAVVWPSIDTTITGLVGTVDRAGYATTWRLKCVLTRSDPPRAPDFLLHTDVKVPISAYYRKVGPRFSKVENTGITLSFCLLLRPKASFMEHEVAQPTDRKTMETAVDELMSATRSDLLRCTFTSNTSLIEAAAQSLERNFYSSSFAKYTKIQCVDTTLRFHHHINGSRVEWLHKRAHQNVTPTSTSSPTTVNSKHLTSVCMLGSELEQQLIISRVHASQGIFSHNNTSVTVSGSEATDLSVIAHRLEEKCEKRALGGLSSFVEGFDAALRDTAPECLDSLIVRAVQREDPENDVDTQNPNQFATPPLRSIELKKNVLTNRVMVSIAVRIQETLNIRFDTAAWDDRPVQLRQIVFEMASVDVPSTARAVAGGLEQEAEHLKTRALTTLGTICDRVRFDDVTAVPNMLAEALTRVVQPLTASLKLEQVTLSLVIGDDPVVITTTIASEQQAALESARQPGLHAIPCVHVELPLHSTSEIKHSKIWSTKK